MTHKKRHKSILNRKKKPNLLNFVIFKELKEKSAFLKIAGQASEAGDFLNIFLRFLGFWGSFSYKKKRVYNMMGRHT